MRWRPKAARSEDRSLQQFRCGLCAFDGLQQPQLLLPLPLLFCGLQVWLGVEANTRQPCCTQPPKFVPQIVDHSSVLMFEFGNQAINSILN